MESQSERKRPVGLTLLILTEVILAILGSGSAIALLLSPSGELMGLPLDLLDGTPVDDFTLVGLFFLAFYGVLPSLASYGLLTMKRWSWTDAINKWTGQHWAWTASTLTGVVLLVWIAVEIVLIGFLSDIGGVFQVIFALFGIWILVLAFLPSVRSSTGVQH